MTSATLRRRPRTGESSPTTTAELLNSAKWICLGRLRRRRTRWSRYHITTTTSIISSLSRANRAASSRCLTCRCPLRPRLPVPGDDVDDTTRCTSTRCSRLLVTPYRYQAVRFARNLARNWSIRPSPSIFDDDIGVVATKCVLLLWFFAIPPLPSSVPKLAFIMSIHPLLPHIGVFRLSRSDLLAKE